MQQDRAEVGVYVLLALLRDIDFGPFYYATVICRM
jgi:hypothetical protein